MTKRSRKNSDGLPSIVRYMQNGHRCVEPYEYVYKSFTKARWIGKTVLAVCASEFVAHDEAYYAEAISNGHITINGNPVGLEYVFRDNDAFHHKAICTENAVCGEPIDILIETDSHLVVAKPSSIPVHACGGYRVNTLVSILSESRAIWGACHRIDRLTSGVVILGKTAEAMRTITAAMQRENGVIKKYLARVTGEFPQALTVKGSIACVDHRIGKYILGTEGKESETEFSLLKYLPDLNESIVECQPITGRTHQIRLHLESVGHPIVNDICYGGKYDSKHPFAFPQISDRFCGGIFLHAHRYVIESIGMDVTAKPPLWAQHE